MLPVLLAAPLAIRGAVGSALRPATRFAGELRRRSAQDLSPVATPDLPIELDPIPQALNGYLDTIRARIDAERQFATNAAHELRTPIAAASGQAQLIAAGLADDAAAGRLAGALSRMGHLVERLLQLSRAEAGAIGAGPCDLIRVRGWSSTTSPAGDVRRRRDDAGPGGRRSRRAGTDPAATCCATR